jgi:hypothetical protein
LTITGSAIAKKHVEAIAKKHGVTVEGLTEAVATTVPMSYHKFNAEQTKQLTEYRESVIDDAKEMVKMGMPAEAIRHIFISIANQITEQLSCLNLNYQ